MVDAKRKVVAWEKVLKARNRERFRTMDMIEIIFEEFMELHGDRNQGDDRAVVAGIAILGGMPVTVIGQQKGTSHAEMAYRNYGMTRPEGYRKALRLMQQAEKFGRAVICIVDTPGAYPGRAAEENGQAEAIASCICKMAELKVPVISVILGEGGSGGALALGVANRIIMLENAVFSVASPEACASILWKDSEKAPEAAGLLRLTAQELYQFGIADRVIEEQSLEKAGEELKKEIFSALKEYRGKPGIHIRQERQERFRYFDAKYL